MRDKKSAMLIELPVPSDTPFIMKGGCSYGDGESPFSAGARYERKALLAKVRREIRVSEMNQTHTPEILFNLEQWILERRKRYESKPGRLGRKKK